MSPNMPANVLRRFFIVSSASSTTDEVVVSFGGTVLVLDRVAEAETDDTVDDCDAWESRRCSEVRVGA